jgi:hypothetical protein
MNRIEKILNARPDLPEVAIKNGYYFIGRKGVGLFTEERDVLKTELEKPNFIAMDALLKAGF